MKIHFTERNFTCYINPHHNHAGDPSKENVGAGFHDVERVIRVFFAFEPVGADDGPVRAGEPSIKGVFIAVIMDAADFDFLEVGAGVKNPFWGLVGFGLVEHGDGNTPRDLAGDVPVFEVLEIVDEDLFLVRGVELNFVVFEVFDGCGGEALDVDEPLGFEHGLDDGIAFVAVGDGVGDFLLTAEKALSFKVSEDLLAAFGSGETGISGSGGFEHETVFTDDGDAGELVAFADFKIVEIVGGGNLHGASAIGRVSVFVGDDGDGAVGEGELELATDEGGVAFVFRINGDRDITKDSFGTGGGDDDFGKAIFGIGANDGVSNFPEATIFVFVLDFDVGEGGLVLGAEIDQLFATIDHAVVPHFLEGGINAGDDVFVKSEGEVGPGARGTEGADLELHVAALFFDEVPDTGIEFVVGVFKTSVTVFLEGALIDDPGLEAGVISTGDIPGGFAAEAIISS